MAYGFVARVFEVFDRHRTPVDLIATSEVSISLTVDDPERLPAIAERPGPAGRGPGPARHGHRERGGPRLRAPAPAWPARIFQALRDVNIVMISFGASDVNVSFVVAEAEAEKAVRGLHQRVLRSARREGRRSSATARWAARSRPSCASADTRRSSPRGASLPAGLRPVGIDFTEADGRARQRRAAALAAGARYVVGTTGWQDQIEDVRAHRSSPRAAGSSTPPTSPSA